MLYFMNDVDGVRTTVFACDHCGLPITDIGLAMALYIDEKATPEEEVDDLLRREQRERIDGQKLIILHKVTCDPQFRVAHRDRCKMGDWDELSDAVAEALHHAGMKVPDDWFTMGKPNRIP